MQFIVTLLPPPTATRSECLAYIDRAVRVECGQLHPEDPLFDLDRDTVKVNYHPVRRLTKQGE
jgi:hypothetical protein